MHGKLQSLTAAGVSLQGNKGQQSVKVLVDTGASFSMVRADVAEKLGSPTKLPRPMTLTIGDGSKIAIADAVLLAMEIGAVKVMDYFLVFESLIEEAILGLSTMKRYGLKIDLEHQSIYSEIREEGEIMKDFLKKLFAALKISASEEIAEDKAIELIAANAAAKAVAEKQSAGIVKTVLAVLELPETANENDVKGTLLALKHPGNVVSREDHDALLAKMRMQEIDNAVGDAIAAGKLTPAEKDWGKKMAEENLATFKAFVTARPKVMPVGEKLQGKKEEPAGAKIDDIQAKINKQMGVSAELFAKYNSTN